VTDLLSIPLGLAIIGLAAWDDAWTYKIRNRFVVLGVVAAVVCHGLCAALGITTHHAFTMAIVNGAAALLAGAALWHFGLWSAGDAKLYAVAALLLPPSIYEARGAWLPAFIVLINASAFVLSAAIVWFFKGVAARARRPAPAAPSTPLSERARGAAAGFVGFLVIMVAGRLINEEAARALGASSASGVGVYLVLFIMMRQISAFFRRRAAFWAAVAAVGAYAAWTGATRGAAGLAALVSMGWISAGIIAFRVLYDRLVKDLDERAIAPGELREGMVLTGAAVTRHGLAEEVKKTDIGVLLPDGLTAGQARDLAAHLAAKGVATIDVSRTAPFAVFLLLGFLATAILGGVIRF
jgi:Flp pilus assembly protein protease CpaA